MAGKLLFKLYKEFVHAGGVNDPLIIQLAKGIADPARSGHQFVDVIDITPTRFWSLQGLKAPERPTVGCGRSRSKARDCRYLSRRFRT